VNNTWATRIILILFFLAVLIYLDFVEIPESLEEKKWKNRVEKVSQAILKEQMEEGQGLAMEEDLEADEEGEDDDEGEVEEGEGGTMEGGANNGDKKPDGWVENPDSDIMDAKVMKRGDKRLIIVDMPDPKARWRKPI